VTFCNWFKHPTKLQMDFRYKHPSWK